MMRLIQMAFCLPIVRRGFLSCLGLSFVCAASFGAETNAPPAETADAAVSTGKDYSRFKIINDRNIFNQNRYPGSSQRPTSPSRQVRVESFALLGTMSYEKGDFAVFDGSSSSFRKILKASDSIGGCKITEITASSVKLDCNGKEINLPIGTQMRRQDEGEWQLGSRAGSYSSHSSETSTGTSTMDSKPPSTGDAKVDDVLKRLMQKRQQEMNK